MKLRERLEELSPDFFNIFKGNLVTLKSILEKCTPIHFTYHGYNHAVTLEKFADDLLPDEIKSMLSVDELFILLHGIYCHDIGMIKYIKNGDLETYQVSRDDHNLTSYEMVYNKSHELKKLIKVPNDEIQYEKSIGLLCLGHRDYKNKEGVLIKTIDIIDETEPYSDGSVHTKFLACIIRIADELDITNKRAPHDILLHLQNFINDFSLQQWKDHKLFSQVKIDHKIFKILLIPNIREIEKLDEKNNDRTIVRNPIFSKRKKIEIELAELLKIFQDENSKYRLGYKEIEIQFDENVITKEDFEIYQNQVDKAIQEASLQVPAFPELAIDFEKEKSKYVLEKIDEESKRIREIVEKEIDDFDRQGKMLSLGHFKLPSGGYSRYYLNTNNFLPKNTVLNAITDLFCETFKNKDIDCIIGIDKAGIILAPILSLKLHCNYTYWINKKEEETSISFEQNLSLQHAKKIILLTDVISTGTMINESIEQVVSKFSPDELFIGCVFCTNKKTVDNLRTRHEIFCISEKFLFSTYTDEEYQSKEELREEFNMITIIDK